MALSSPGQTVVELTSGSMGAGLALVCGALGHPFVAVMSRGNSEERARLMLALGAEVVLVDQCPGGRPGQVSGADLALVEDRAGALVEERGAFRADQFQRSGAWLAHEETTGRELWEQTGGEIDAFADFVGSGGAYAGVSRALKARRPAIKGFVVEPAGAAVLAGQAVTRPDHPIQGGGYTIDPLPFLNGLAIDGYVQVSGEEARDTARALARQEGAFAGYSSGANVAAALRLLEGEMAGKAVAVLLCDSGFKYLSTDLWP